MKPQSSIQVWAAVGLLVLLLIGCSAPTAAPSADAPLPTPTASLTPTLTSIPPSPTPTPTLTPTPLPPPVWNVVTHPDESQAIRDMTLGLDQSLWIAGDLGVFNLNLDTGQYSNFSHKTGLPGFSAVDILTDAQGAIWIVWGHSTYKAYGVSRFDGSQWSHFTAENGLASNFVNEVVASDDGKLWFSTPAGLSCYDGSAWTTYTSADGLPSDEIGAIAAGKNGILWAATPLGVASFDGSQWTAYDEKSFKRVDINDIAVTPDGMVWFGTTDNFIRYDGQEFKIFKPEEGAKSFSDFTVTKDGTLWALNHSILAETLSRGIYAWRNNHWYYFLEETGLPTYGGNGLLASNDGSLWMTTSKDGLIRASNWAFYASGVATVAYQRYCTSGSGVILTGRFSVEDLKKDTCLDERHYYGNGLETADGRKVFYSSFDLIVLYPSGEYQILSLPRPDPEPAFVTPSFDLHGQGQVMRLQGYNLMQYIDEEWHNLSEENPLFEDSVMIKTAPDGRVWVAGAYALSVWDGQAWAHWSEKNKDGSYNLLDIMNIAFAGQDVWVADGLRGFSKLTGGQVNDPDWVTIENPWGELSALPLLETDSRGGLWAARQTGLPAYFNGSTWKTFSEDAYNEIYVSAMSVDAQDRLWIGLANSLGLDWGRARFNYEHFLLRYNGRTWQNLTADESLPPSRVSKIVFTPDESTWVSFYEHGVVRFDSKGDTWTPFNTSNVFSSSDNVIDMLVDQTGAIWFLLGDGYARYGLPQQTGE